MSNIASPITADDVPCPAPQRHAGWPAIFSLAFGVFGLVTAELLPVSILTPMANELHASTGVIGQAVTATALVAALAGPLVVLGAGRIDRRLIVLAFMAMLVGSSMLAAVATRIEVLLLARAILGFALGGFWALTTALALRLVPSDQVPRALSVIAMGVSLATVFAAPLAAALGELLGWRATFLAVAGIGGISLVVQLFALPSLPATGGAGLAAFRTALSRRAVMIGIATSIVVVSGHFAGFTFIRPFLETVPRLSIGAISLALFAFGIGGFLGNAAAGAVAARGPASGFGGSALLIGLCAVALVLDGQSQAAALVATAIWGFAFGGIPVSASIWNARVAPDIAESAGALLACAFQVAIASGALIGGLLIDRVGAGGVIAYAAIAAFAGAALMLTAGRAVPLNNSK